MNAIRQIYNKWTALAQKIGNFQATLIFSFLYFLLVTPIGIMTQIFSPTLKTGGASNWTKIQNQPSSLKRLREQ